ncbi:MAG TPA: RNA polymerase sigma factor [Caldisericia bacterium]|nr:RNA polymerase sigma factor [Caldisericia bacterium]HOL83142.1 RNA polymerase sigma factor [Caldisericia bacterium]HON83437.1 RNA polymerase sigma factor [Caldisericia bacterium]HPC56852.1 RNA polymerase sigma factor [Caldisericia bacterium]HPP43510.1 RNA polymerase sigma factor [Caldisericia bacterium]
MNDVPDSKIIKEVKKGDKEMFGLLVEKYSDRVFSYFIRFLGDRDEALNLTSEVFFKAFKGIKNFDENKEFFPWLIKIARNEGINFMRKNKVYEELETDKFTEENYFERDVMLEDALKKLNENDREILLLFYQQDLSYDEIANILNISLENVKVRIFRAKEKLRKLLYKEVGNGREI